MDMTSNPYIPVKYVPLVCLACGARWNGPSTAIGTSCRHMQRPAGAVDIFQDNPSSTQEAF